MSFLACLWLLIWKERYLTWLCHLTKVDKQIPREISLAFSVYSVFKQCCGVNETQQYFLHRTVKNPWLTVLTCLEWCLCSMLSVRGFAIDWEISIYNKTLKIVFNLESFPTSPNLSQYPVFTEILLYARSCLILCHNYQPQIWPSRPVKQQFEQ